MIESPLEQLLNGKSQAFKDKVRSLVQRYGIDENDPTFILLIGTSTLEALLDKYPQEFETLFRQLLSQMDKRWGELQQGWAIAAGQSTAVATQLTHSINGLKQASIAEQETIRKQAGSQAELLTAVFQEQRNELKAQAEKLAAHAIASARATAAEQVKEINKGVRVKHYVEAGAISCACAAALMLTSWTTGWVSRGRAEDNTAWADIERWNTKALQACVKAGTATCNFHIEVPKAKNE